MVPLFEKDNSTGEDVIITEILEVRVTLLLQCNVELCLVSSMAQGQELLCKSTFLTLIKTRQAQREYLWHEIKQRCNSRTPDQRPPSRHASFKAAVSDTFSSIFPGKWPMFKDYPPLKTNFSWNLFLHISILNPFPLYLHKMNLSTRITALLRPLFLTPFPPYFHVNEPLITD